MYSLIIFIASEIRRFAAEYDMPRSSAISVFGTSKLILRVSADFSVSGMFRTKSASFS